MSRQRLFGMLELLTPRLLPLSRMLGRIPVVGGGLKRLVPVANYDGILPLNESQQLEWSLLDTFDMLAPEYDQPQTLETVRDWLERAGLDRIEILRVGHLVGRGMVANATGD